MSYKVTYDPGAFNPMVQSFHSKIDLPTPNPTLMYCIKKIENFPELGYCYLTVLVERAGEPYQTILFYTYASSNAGYRYSRFIEGIKTLVPLHSTRIKEDCLIVFERDKECPCGWTLDQIKGGLKNAKFTATTAATAATVHTTTTTTAATTV